MTLLPLAALASTALAPAAHATATADPSTDPSAPSTTDVTQTVEAVAATTVDVFSIAWRAGLGTLVGIALAFVGVVVLRALGRRQTMYAEVSRYTRTALYALGGLIGAYLGVQVAIVSVVTPDWTQYAMQALSICIILSVAWVIVGLIKALEATIVSGVRAGGDPGRANRVTTQAQILRRVAEAIVVICGLVGAIMTFPSARFAMGSLFASAGLVSVIAGLAAQSMLSNIFAGLQLAVTDAIRVDDVVVVKEDQGYIEEITLTYVVVRVWDDRRLIYPSTYFTQNPFANWSAPSSPASSPPRPSGMAAPPTSTSPTPPAARSRCALRCPAETPPTSSPSSAMCARRSWPGSSRRRPTPCRARAWRSSRSRSRTTPSPSRWRAWPRSSSPSSTTTAPLPVLRRPPCDGRWRATPLRTRGCGPPPRAAPSCVARDARRCDGAGSWRAMPNGAATRAPCPSVRRTPRPGSPRASSPPTSRRSTSSDFE